MNTSNPSLDELRFRELPEMTGRDGRTWTPRVPREFVIRGTAFVVEVVDLVTGSEGTPFAHVMPLAAMHVLHCPRSVKVADLEELRR